jgi:hypothetical protein
MLPTLSCLMTAAIAPGVGPRAGRGRVKRKKGAENGEGLQKHPKGEHLLLCSANRIANRL